MDNLRDKPVVVLSTGRSGSTLLQKLLNTHPELTIWGEHEGILNGLINVSSLVEGSAWIPEDNARGEWLLSDPRPLNVERWTAWDGPFSKADYRASVKAFIERLFASRIDGRKRWGFKEIRYRQMAFVDFFVSLYPCSNFVFLLRNPVDACVSFSVSEVMTNNLSPNQFGGAIERIADNQIKPFISLFTQATSSYPGQARILLYEKLVGDPQETMEDLRLFLDLEDPFDQQSISVVMGKDIVSNRKRSDKELLKTLRGMASKALASEVECYEKLRASQAGQSKD